METTLVSPRPAAARKKRGLWRSLQKNGVIYLFLLPTFSLLAIFTFYPIYSAFLHSFYRWDGVNSQFVGLGNFVEMFTVDRAFIASLPNVLKLTLFRVIVALTIPLLAAEVIFSLRSSRIAYFWRVLL